MMVLCWNCNSQVVFLEDGWVCPVCCQHGRPDLIAENWERGKEINAPYMEKRNANQ